MDDITVDKILFEIGGIGRYQIKNIILFSIVMHFIMSPFFNYVFITQQPKYRCYIDECEANEPKYEEDWIKNAIPFADNAPKRCLRYNKLNPCSNCSENIFNKSDIISCSKFVFENPNEVTLAQDFNIFCDENLWKLTSIGTFNQFGSFVGLPLSGYLSDRYGRKTMMLIALLTSTICGTLKSFSPSYIILDVLEFIEMVFLCAIYSTTYCLGIEMLGAETRTLGSTIFSISYACGGATMAVAAWLTSSWRTFLRVIYMPGVLFVSYIWLVDESVRWLVSKNQKEKAISVLKKIAKVNKKYLQEDMFRSFIIKSEEGFANSDTLFEAFRSFVLLRRCITCSFIWLSCTFVYYGLNINAVEISGHMYINYILVSLIEIPAYIIANFLLDYFGRKFTLSFSFFMCGLAFIIYIFLPENNISLQLAAYLLGKFAITITYMTLYLYAMELFPTSLRQSFMSIFMFSETFAAMAAPQIPMLGVISKHLPIITFSGLSVICGFLSLSLPETKNVQLPETIADSVNLGTADEQRLF